MNGPEEQKKATGRGIQSLIVREAFTLVEILVSLALFSILASCLVSGILQSRRMAENAVFENTALNIATSYLEQIKSMPYQDILDILENGETTLSPFLLQGDRDSLDLDTFNFRSISIQRDGEGNSTRQMRIWIKPLIVDQNMISSQESLHIRIVYKWINPESGKERMKVLRTVRSRVETY